MAENKEAASGGPRIPAAMALRHGLQQRAHQQPLSGRQIQVRPNPQTGPDTRQATVSIGEKLLAALRSPKAAPPVIAFGGEGKGSGQQQRRRGREQNRDLAHPSLPWAIRHPASRDAGFR